MSRRKYRIRREYRDNLPPTHLPFVYIVEKYVGFAWLGFWMGLTEHADQESAEWWLANHAKPDAQKWENKVIKEVEIDG